MQKKATPTIRNALSNDTKVLDSAEWVKIMGMVVKRPPGVGRRIRPETLDFSMDDAGSGLHELSITKKVLGLKHRRRRYGTGGEGNNGLMWPKASGHDHIVFEVTNGPVFRK